MDRKIGRQENKTTKKGRDTMLYSWPNPTVSLRKTKQVSISLYSKRECNSLYGPRQLLLQRLIILVRWQVNAVEARMTLWQLVGITRLLDSEPSRPIRALQVLEAVNRNPRRTRRELQQARLALRWPAPDALPEPLHNLVVDLVTAVVCELGPVVAAAMSSIDFGF